MTKEHKKLYKAGKNWVVATLTATTITVLGGIGAYTAHADTTTEDTQSIQTESINQPSQNDSSNNSVVLNQHVTTQSNSTVQSTQYVQANQVTQNYQNTPTAATADTSINDSDELDPSSLWYKPDFSAFEDEVEKSGLRLLNRQVQDPRNPNITIYYSFLDPDDKPEIQRYAHALVSRCIYIKKPQSSDEDLVQRYDLQFNRWVAVDTSQNNKVVGVGHWVFSLAQQKRSFPSSLARQKRSFPKYYIPQIDGYTSYCNGKMADTIDKEQISNYKPSENYHITYVPTSSLVDKKIRTIIIKYPDGKQESTIQNTVLSNSTCIWPKYVIPARDGYDSYVDGLKTSIVPEQTVDVNDDNNVIVNVTYKISTWGATHKTITRTIYIHDTDGNVDIIPQTVNFMRYIVTDAQGNPTSYTDWVGDGSFGEYAIPQHEGFISQIGSEDTKVVPSQLVNPNDEDTIVNVTYKKAPVTPSKDKHKAITRTIKITYPSGYVQTISQTVNYTYHTVKIGSEVLAGWVADGNDSWDEYAIPQHEGFISQVDSQDAKIVPSQHVTSNDENMIINVTYKQDPAMLTSKTITRTIRIHDINGYTLNTITQKVNYTRNAVTDTQGNIISYTDWVADGNDSWNEYAIPQHDGYISQVNSKDTETIPSQHVNLNDKNVTINVTYKQDPTTNKTITRTIRIHDINGNIINTITQKVNYARTVTFDTQGNIISFTDWSAVGKDSWNEYAIPQHDGYISQVNSKDTETIPSQHVNPNDKNVTINVTYTNNSKGNNNPSRLNNEVPYDSTTVLNNVNANYGNLDGYRLTENEQGQTQLIASGWHATGASNSDRYRYMIVYDNTLGREIARQKLVPQVRSDVQRAYPNVDNSLYSGFNITIDIPNSSTNHSLSLIARYSSDPNNGEGDRVDYWFNSLAFNEGNQANLDGLSSNGNTLTVNGWHATNQAAGRPYHYIIAWDRNLGHEIARQEVTAVSRPDVANVYNTVANAVNSGFSVNFNLTPQFFNDDIQFISRWTDDAAGNGNAVDYWFKAMNRENRANLDSVTLSNGQVQVAGWHATDLSQLEPNHYLIVFDNTTGQQVASEKVDLQSSQDVKNVFGDIQTANHSRFNYTFDSLHLIPGHNYSLVSRYSADATGNGNNGAHTDSWLNMGAFQQSAYSIDNVALNQRHMTVQGWLANDNAMTKPYAYAILIQNGREIGRQRLTLSERDDVAKVYPQIYRSQYSGFNANFDLPTFSTRGLQLVLRFTDDPVGNGNSSDNWINL